MSKTIFISNRLPVTIGRSGGKLSYEPSIGGLATGLKSVHDEGNSLWVGWCGLPEEDLSKKEQDEIDSHLRNVYRNIPIFLSQSDIDDYYYGFCNRTIWPMFHYFTDEIEYQHELWQAYRTVNQKFFKKLEGIIESGDTIWVHDYQLMLLPGMIREKFPDTVVGFFLHIPFPSYEIFRLLPWREEVLRGLLGADLVGFHTYDYVRHFTSSVRRILGYEHNLGFFHIGNRLVKADVFPMGIDYKRYCEAHSKSSVREESREVLQKAEGTKLILSVDRLDYTKGIPGRIRSYSEFLRNNPEYLEKVTMILIVAPSRTEVETYSELLREIEELVGNTNGEHGTMGWVPVWFFYRSFGFESLVALYSAADVLLVTPLRDGMNLVAKEYIAARADNKGMLVLSETAGAASELGEAVIVNANNVKEVAEGIKTALEMPEKEQISRNTIMHKRLRHYNVEFWAQDFLQKLDEIRKKQERDSLIKINRKRLLQIRRSMKKAEKRLFLLDYDGTMTGYMNKPGEAKPDAELLGMLEKLCAGKKNTVVIISGRDRDTLEKWFGHLPLNLIAEHGMWIRKTKREWDQLEFLKAEWKDTIRPLLEMHTARTPGSFIEEKSYSLAWHYRRCEPELAAVRVNELKDALEDLTGNMNIGLLDSNKVIEIKDTTVNKSRAASIWLNDDEWDFIFSAGDDWSDEDIFSILPENAWSIKVGTGISEAQYQVDDADDVRKILMELTENDDA
ncbi:MAG: bifunctional alpha,alpha-trehalose-phosphate synthase (UDP-forming)/trehalose-phosphatase [Candidatus Marinimicrobia bacterium]|nr:bifunctional alpha,alpha-trehalose-phosphate synthase (UDP-forming)/trehalose-phosphatase [Candidatus Neomarinimicrobiota bacterium]